MVSSPCIQRWIGTGVTALTLALPLAESSAAVITPISQDRSTAVEVRNYHWTCPFEEIQQDGTCNIPVVIIADETLDDGQIASDFGPFSANTSVPVEGTNSRATQESGIYGASLVASGAFSADGLEQRYIDTGGDWTYHSQYIRSQAETRFSLTFSLDEVIPFYLRGDLELEGGLYCDPDFFGNPAQASLRLTGPSGDVVNSAISLAVGLCSPTLALRETGQLDPGVYTLEVMAGGEGSATCAGFVCEATSLTTYGEFSLQLGLGPRQGPVPALPSGAIALLAALLATLGATSLFPRK